MDFVDIDDVVLRVFVAPAIAPVHFVAKLLNVISFISLALACIVVTIIVATVVDAAFTISTPVTTIFLADDLLIIVVVTSNMEICIFYSVD